MEDEQTQDQLWAMDHYRETLAKWSRAEDRLGALPDPLIRSAETAAEYEGIVQRIDAQSEVNALQREAILTVLRLLVGQQQADLVALIWGHAEMIAGRGAGEASSIETILASRKDLAEAAARLVPPSAT